MVFLYNYMRVWCFCIIICVCVWCLCRYVCGISVCVYVCIYISSNPRTITNKQHSRRDIYIYIERDR